MMEAEIIEMLHTGEYSANLMARPDTASMNDEAAEGANAACDG